MRVIEECRQLRNNALHTIKRYIEHSEETVVIARLPEWSKGVDSSSTVQEYSWVQIPQRAFFFSTNNTAQPTPHAPKLAHTLLLLVSQRKRGYGHLLFQEICAQSARVERLHEHRRLLLQIATYLLHPSPATLKHFR